MSTISQYRLGIQGMSCGGCVESVRRVLARVPGVTVKSVGIGEAVVEVATAPEVLEKVAAGLSKAGFGVVVSQVVGREVDRG